jgi:hypothetical protein
VPQRPSGRNSYPNWVIKEVDRIDLKGSADKWVIDLFSVAQERLEEGKRLFNEA